MPTNRPFLANFLAAFRAHSAFQSASPTTSVSATSTSQPQSFQPATTRTPARTITTKTPTHGATTAAVQQATGHLSHHHTRHPSNQPVSRSPASPTANFASRQRRGSDSSSEGGFRDVLGSEKWYVGGRTAAGEERFYRLGMVRKERSGDRLSLDRLSL
ncbi:hypothetical protein MMC12_007952 [Toensbergia leucococca]|nr:hypothetical protein [Toensbergia leucococca]